LITQLKNTGDPVVTKGLQERLALLDARQLQLESDIQTTGQQLTRLGSGQVLALSIVFTVFVLGPLAIGFARMMLKRATSRPAPPAPVLNDMAQRLERVEGAVDTIALEIERISEGQRFVTKLLSENQPAPMLGAGQRSAEPARSG
jgi:hypothetical protein